MNANSRKFGLMIAASVLAGASVLTANGQTAATRNEEIVKVERELRAAAAVEAGARIAAMRSAQASNNLVFVESLDGKSHTIEIRVNGDTMTILRDGQEIPKSQILESGDSIVITDEAGKPLQTVHFRKHSNLPGMVYRTRAGDAQASTIWTAAPSPTVMLGVHMAAPGAALEKHLGLDPNSSTMINGVYEGLPAYQAGLREFDILTKIDGETPADSDAIRKKLAEKQPHDVLTLTVIQSGKVNQVQVTLAAHDREALAKAKLLGAAADDVWTRAMGLPDGAEFSIQGMRDWPVIVAPQIEMRERLEAMKPRIEAFNAWSSEALAKSRVELESRLEKLNERLAEMEKNLQKLLERKTD